MDGKKIEAFMEYVSEKKKREQYIIILMSLSMEKIQRKVLNSWRRI